MSFVQEGVLLPTNVFLEIPVKVNSVQKAMQEFTSTAVQDLLLRVFNIGIEVFLETRALCQHRGRTAIH